MAFFGAHKFTSSRRQELQLKRELDTIKSKALVEHYAKQQAPQLQSGEVLTHRLPSQPKLKPSHPPRKHTISAKKTSHAQEGTKKQKTEPPFSRKITIDTSGKRSFAVASVPAKYSSREPPKLHKGVTREADQPPKSREAEKTAPWLISQASIEESESSSHGDYMQMDSPATTTAPTTNVKMSEGKGPALPSMQAGSGSSKASFESSSSLSMTEGDRAGCSSTPLQHSGRKRERDGDGMMLGGGEGEQEETAHPQSAALVLEVDMRFSSEPLDRVQSDRTLSPGNSPTFSRTNELQVHPENDMPTESKQSASPVDLESGQESEWTSQHSQDLHLSVRDQSRAENTGVLEAVDSDTHLSHASGELQSSLDSAQRSSSTLITEEPAGPTLEMESDDETTSFKQETETHLPNTQENVRSDISLTMPSVSQTSNSEPCFQSHSDGSHSSFRGLGSSSSVGVAKEPIGGIGEHWSINVTTQRPNFLNSKSLDFDSSSLKADSSSEKFSSPFSGDLSSFGIPFSFQSQTLSTSSQKSEKEDIEERNSFFHSQHDLDTSISESSLPHPPLHSSSTLLASGNGGSYTFSSLPAAIKTVTSSGVMLTEGERMEGAYTQTSGASLQFHIQSSSDLHEPTGLAAESDVTELVDTQPLLQSFDTGGEEQPEAVTRPELKVDTAGKTDSRHKDIAPDGVSLEGFADEKESATPTQIRSGKAPCLTDVHSTMANLLEQNSRAIPQENLAEFLAFSSRPVTLEDILRVQGRGVEGRGVKGEGIMPPTVSQPSANTSIDSVNTGGSVRDEGNGKEQNESCQKVVFLSTWTSHNKAPQASVKPPPTSTSIHHFCMEPLFAQLPATLQTISRRTHTSQEDWSHKKVQPAKPRSVMSREVAPAAQQNHQHHSPHNTPKRSKRSKRSKTVMDIVRVKLDGSERFAVSGTKMDVVKDPNSLLWTPAPPKLSLHPSTIQSHLFPEYQSPTPQGGAKDSKREEEGRTRGEKLQPRLLDPVFRSVPEFLRLRDCLHHKEIAEEVKGETPVDRLASEEESEVVEEEGMESEGVMATKIDLLEVDSKDQGDLEAPCLRSSQPHRDHHTANLHHPPPPTTHIPTELSDSATHIRPTQSLPEMAAKLPTIPLAHSNQYNTFMDELERQKNHLAAYHQSKQQQLEEELTSQSMDSSSQLVEGSSLTVTSKKLQRQALRGAHHKGGRVRALRRTKSALLRAQQARELLSLPPQQLKRSGSFPLFHNELLRLTSQEEPPLSRRMSEPAVKDFESFMHAQGASPHEDPYQWAYSVWWDRWFPEVLEECRRAVAELYSESPLVKVSSKPRPQGTRKEIHKEMVEGEERMKMTEIQLVDLKPLADSNTAATEHYEEEVQQLSEAILDSASDPSLLAVRLCRKGALLRKLGRLRESKEDLDRAISLEPTLSDAYWHRHALFLLQSNEEAALEDLQTVLKHNRKHFGAFRSKARLLTKQGEISAAIYCYSQAIALLPLDPESYFLRAELHEKQGKVEAALSDYAKVYELDPGNTEALRRQAMHKFKRGLWSAATQHFTTLLLKNPNDTSARIYRARAQYNLGHFIEALQDLSAAIHLDPNGSQAFYHRACLLRSHEPKQALRDYSISLLLDDSASNVQAYVHRGVLYTQMKCYDEALSDFEAAIRLQRSLPSPYVCAGLIHLLQRDNSPRATRCFSAALAVDPTCLRAYLCHAEALKKDGKYTEAILDYTRAIHLEPNNPTHYLHQGELYLRLKQFDMAALHVRIAAKLSSGFDHSRKQRALVESFLGNHQEALSLLKGLPKSPAVFTLMGKVHQKAGHFDSAAENFRQALRTASQPASKSKQTPSTIHSITSSTTPHTPLTPSEKSELHFLCGWSLMKNSANQEAVEEFEKVLWHTSDHERAYFECGIVKLRAGNSKGVLDLNRALAINPQFFQAYLARAAHFGKSGRYAKAILNCNEAIKLVPKSVRAYLCRGALKYHTKSYSSAIEDFTTAINMDPSHASLAHFNRALCHQATGELEKAMADYNTALQMGGAPPVKVLVNRGLLHLQLMDHTSALLDFAEASKVVPDDPAMFQAIGFCYHQLGALDSAVEAYSEALDLDPAFLEGYLGRGNACMDYLTEQGNSRSRIDYLQALELDASYLPARVNLAILHQAEGRFQQAWDELTATLERNKCYVPALEARAIISLQMGNLFGAMLDITAALKLSPSAALHTNRGVIHQFMGDVTSAMEDYQRATILDSHYFLAHFNAGNILFHQKLFKQAVSTYSEALKSSEDDDACLVNRAIAYVMLGESDNAMDDFNKALEANPYAAHIYFNRGNLHRSLENYERAEQDYRKALELEPHDWVVIYSLGALTRRPQEATELFRTAAELEESNTDT